LEGTAVHHTGIVDDAVDDAGADGEVDYVEAAHEDGEVLDNHKEVHRHNLAVRRRAVGQGDTEAKHNLVHIVEADPDTVESNDYILVVLEIFLHSHRFPVVLQ